MEKADPPDKRPPVFAKHRAVGRDTVEILIGDDPKPFLVHIDIIKHSRFFEKALKGGFIEAKKKRLSLQVPKSAEFAVYIDWLYFGAHLEFTGFEDLGDLFILADFLQDTNFTNVLIDLVIDWIITNSKCPTELAVFSWEELPTGHKLQKLMIDFWAWTGGEFYKRQEDDAQHGRWGIWVAISRRRFLIMRDVLQPDFKMPPQPWIANRCQYHDHDDGHKCAGAKTGGAATGGSRTGGSRLDGSDVGFNSLSLR